MNISLLMSFKLGEEENVNVIVPHIEILTPVEVIYYNKPPITPLVISFSGLVPYCSNKVVSYKYSSTILEGGVEIPIQPLSHMDNII